MNLPHVIEAGRMTEKEARMVGHAATKLAQLRNMLTLVSGGAALTMKTASLSLHTADVTACLALLIEREAAFLLGFNIELEQPAA